MNFNELSSHEKTAVTHRELERRKDLREKGKQEAADHLFENTYRIQKTLRGIKRSKPAW
jgi:16S rRNA C1402 (ribose-2'-O) methylase RsmI